MSSMHQHWQDFLFFTSNTVKICWKWYREELLLAGGLRMGSPQLLADFVGRNSNNIARTTAQMGMSSVQLVTAKVWWFQGI